MTSSYNAIIFDLGGVILNIDYNLVVASFRKLGEEHFDELYAKSHQDKIFDQFETGKISAAEFRKYMKAFLADSITEDDINKAWNSMLLDLPKHRIDLLFKLKDKYRIFLFSNTNEIHLRGFRKIIEETYVNPNLLETIFHKTYYSHLIGMRKPNAEAFQFILDEQGLNAKQTLFIDDSIQHIEGAKKMGFQTIHIVNADIIDIFR